MIKASKISWLFENRVIVSIDQIFNELGFRYTKNKKAFGRSSGEFSQFVKLSFASNPVSYNEEEERIMFNFTLSSPIESPTFEHWIRKKTGRPAFFHLPLESINSFVTISIRDFQQEDYLDIFKSRTYPLSVLSSHSFQQKHEGNLTYALEELKMYKIKQLIEKLDSKSNFSDFISNNYVPSPSAINQAHLLFYNGSHELAKAHYDSLHQHLVSEINKNSPPTVESIKNLEEFIERVKVVSGFDYQNTVKRSLKLKSPLGANFNFTTDHLFSEVFRLDVSEMEITDYQINGQGMTLLFLENKKVILLNPKGEIVLETVIKYDDRCYNIGGYFTGIIDSTDDFYVNHYVFKADLSILELPLMIDFSNAKKNKIRPFIRDISYSNSTEKYYVLFPIETNTQVWIYDGRGRFESKFTIEGKPRKIIIKNRWIISSKSDKYNCIWDFEGRLLGTYEYGKGNDGFEFSKTYKYLFSFNYSTKSQFYFFPSEKAKTLWAHPTYITGYKDFLYADTHHNFGVDTAKFSPDEQCLVAGAYHGKYVMWLLPSLQRIELIPSEDAQTKMIQSYVFKDGDWHASETRAEVVEFMGEKFLKNRSNHIRGIYFLDKGEFFITAIGDNMVLLWNRFGENLAFFDDTGKVILHNSQYLSQLKNKELVLFSR